MTRIDLDNTSDEVRTFFESLPEGDIITFTLHGRTILGISPPRTDAEKAKSAERVRAIMAKARANCAHLSEEQIERLVEEAVDEVRRSRVK
jgi:hypothetical protein